MDLVVFEQNKPSVLDAFCRGEFDYIEAASELVETEFFRFIQARKIVERLAQSYPTPRRKHDVPLWLYVASNLSMRLRGVHAFHGFPLLVRSGGMLNAFGACAGRKVTHPDTGDVTLHCEGTNRKNHYQRQTPLRSGLSAQALPRHRSVPAPALVHHRGGPAPAPSAGLGQRRALHRRWLLPLRPRQPRLKIARKCERIHRDIDGLLRNPRPP